MLERQINESRCKWLKARERIECGKIKEILEKESGPIVLNMCPHLGSGHSVIIDLDNNQFYDINAGGFQYSSRQEFINGFLTWIKAAYPSFCTTSARWDIERPA